MPATEEFPYVYVDTRFHPEYRAQEEYKEIYRAAFWNSALSEPEMRAMTVRSAKGYDKDGVAIKFSPTEVGTMRFRPVYISVYTTFTSINETSWYGAYINMIAGRNPFNCVFAALDMAFVEMNRKRYPAIKITTPGYVVNKLGALRSDLSATNVDTLAMKWQLPLTLSIYV
jgi:hypothetical protein